MSTNSTAHTAGPWVADDGNGDYYVIAEKSTGALIAILAEPRPKPYSGMMPLPAPENPGDEYNEALAAISTANARLIAAAPDLLAALENLISCCEAHPAFTKPTNTITRGRMEAARAAIAAAKGGAA